jgi:hypothetical protein
MHEAAVYFELIEWNIAQLPSEPPSGKLGLKGQTTAGQTTLSVLVTGP